MKTEKIFYITKTGKKIRDEDSCYLVGDEGDEVVFHESELAEAVAYAEKNDLDCYMANANYNLNFLPNAENALNTVRAWISDEEHEYDWPSELRFEWSSFIESLKQKYNGNEHWSFHIALRVGEDNEL